MKIDSYGILKPQELREISESCRREVKSLMVKIM